MRPDAATSPASTLAVADALPEVATGLPTVTDCTSR